MNYKIMFLFLVLIIMVACDGVPSETQELKCKYARDCDKCGNGCMLKSMIMLAKCRPTTEEFECTCKGGKCERVVEDLECSSDSDCVKGGCSGTICQSKDSDPIFTTCEYSPEYACYREINCGCVNGKCSWDKTDAFDQCVLNARESGAGVIV